MLADQYTTIRDQCICTFFFKVKACPAVCVFYFHCYGWAYTLCSKIERSISGNNLCIWECTYITHFAVILCNCSIFDHFIQFQTCNYTRYITCFINICEIVMHIRKTTGCCLSSCCVAKLNIRIFSCCFQYIAFMTKAVCKNDLATLICKVCCCVETSFIFTNQSLFDDLGIIQSKCFLHFIDTSHMSCGISLILITDVNGTDLQIFFCHAICCIYRSCC